MEQKYSKTVNLAKRIQFHQSSEPPQSSVSFGPEYRLLETHGPKNSSLLRFRHVSKLTSSDKVVQSKDILTRSLHANLYLPPSTIVFQPQKLKSYHKWRSSKPMGAALKNIDHTCFINVILHSLCYSPTFSQHLLEKQHSMQCHQQGFCWMCQLETIICKIHDSPRKVIAPTSFAKNLRDLSSSFKLGEQQDAHEYFHLLMSRVHGSLLPRTTQRLPLNSECTTFVYQALGGTVQSRLTCSECQTQTFSFFPFLDISLDIRGSLSLEKAISKYFGAETLDQSNKHKCSSCQKLNSSTIRTSLRDPPNTLCIHLKRFKMSTTDKAQSATAKHIKLSDHVNFSLSLDVTPYLSPAAKPFFSSPCRYSLCSVVVHNGNSAQSGHYTSFHRAPNGIWNSVDGETVRVVGTSAVLNSQAYMLFYQLDGERVEVFDGQQSTAQPEEAKEEQKSLPITPDILLDDIVSTDTHDRNPPQHQVPKVVSRKLSSGKTIRTEQEEAADLSESLLSDQSDPDSDHENSSDSSSSDENDIDTIRKRRRNKPSSTALIVDHRRHPTHNSSSHQTKKNQKQDHETVTRAGIPNLFSAETKGWEDESTRSVNLLPHELQMREKERDSYDKEYDAGKVDKVREKKEEIQPLQRNPFQRFEDLRGAKKLVKKNGKWIRKFELNKPSFRSQKFGQNSRRGGFRGKSQRH
ncbi:putative Ubiquitin carboxyl-terminal hydrolase 42 [Blattamonas nauphoetae]|uniref:ubiquitinyl hydrolase 1 n=1 Tax=Blattamonas nauphoetae TaxID=2049346 RepID=A0ABQ9YM05_9EUKA|nr:putative Ubiquitin carboxyl-terminal hydrolase 42 [Blattamonas nauphoetae]